VGLPKSFSKSGSEEKINKLLEGFKFFRYSDFESNPKYEDVIKCLNILDKYEFDYIVTVGGGSVIDFAKLINIGAHITTRVQINKNNINNIKYYPINIAVFAI
jgi:alcohol dehydrogenase class IV